LHCEQNEFNKHRDYASTENYTGGKLKKLFVVVQYKMHQFE